MKEKIYAYCVKCRRMTEMQDPIEELSKNGRKRFRDVCSHCGTKTFRFRKK